MHRRSPLHRATALVSGLLLLQLSTLASGTLCRMDGDGPTRVAAAAGAHLSGGPTRAHVGSAHAADASNVTAMSDASGGMPAGACDMAGTSHSCDAPWSSGTCNSSSGCLTTTAAVALADGSVSQPKAGIARIVASAMMPAGPAFAPELPPPRA